MRITLPDPGSDALLSPAARLGLLGNRRNTERELLNQTTALFHFPEPQHRKLFEAHVIRVIVALAQLGRDLSTPSIIEYIAPELLEKISYELPLAQGIRLRGYLDSLAEWVARYLADIEEFSLQTLRRAGVLPSARTS